MNPSTNILLIFLGLITLTCNSVKNVKDNKDVSIKSDDRWQKVDSLEQKGLYRSAWGTTSEIYADAKERGDFQTQYKALCYQLKYAVKVEDSSELDAIKKLEEVALNADMPLKAIAQSMCGEAYWSYFEQHRWEILQRTPAPGVEDIRFWDLARFVDACDLHFKESLKDPAALKAIQIDQLAAELVERMEFKELRPSLYEMLAYRALDFYTDKSSGLTRPKDFFKMDQDWFYEPADAFMDHELSKSDTLSFTYKAIHIYQELLKIQAKGSDERLSTDLERLLYIKGQSTVPERKGILDDMLLQAALKKVYESASTSAIIADYGYEEASLYFSAADSYAQGKVPERMDHFLMAEKKCDAIIARFPGSRGATMAQNLKLIITQRELQVIIEEVIIPEQASLCRLTYKNLPKVYFRIAPVPSDFMEGEQYDREQYAKELCKLDPIESWNLELQGSEDHQLHSMESKMPAIPAGHYVLLVSAESEFNSKTAKSYTMFWSTHIGYQESTSESGATRIHLQDRDNGKDLKDAEIIRYFLEYDRDSKKNVKREFNRYKTDANGEVLVEPRAESYRYNQEYLEIKWNKELYETGFYAYGNNTGTQTYQSTKFFLDRSIYRPGQTLYFKGIHMNIGPDGPSVATDQDIEVILRDANYQEISKLNLRSNEFGSINGTFTLPSSGLTGNMSLQSPYGGANFSVEEYKRPKFQVSMDPLEGIYALGSQVNATGIAMGYNGAAVSDAEVRYLVERTPVLRWSYWGWWYRPAMQSQEAVQISQGKTVTDAEGKFKIDFEALKADPNGDEDISHYTFKIDVEVSDINGETRTTSSSVNIGEKGFMLSSDVPSEVNNRSLPEIHIITQNLNGVDVPMSGQWELRAMPKDDRIKTARRWEYPEYQGIPAEEFNKDLKLFYADMADETPQAEGTLIATGEWNTAVNRLWENSALKNAALGDYVLKLIAQDGPEPSSWSTVFTLFDTEGNKPAFKEALRIVDLGAPYQPSGNGKILISSAWSGLPVELRLEFDNKIVWKKDMVLDGSQETVTFPIKRAYQEGLHLHIYAMMNNREFSQTLEINVLALDRNLDVSLETFRDKMLPGSKEEWKLKVKAQNGEKAISELLLSMYDASLDQFKFHAWTFSPWQRDFAKLGNRFKGFGASNGNLFAPEWYQQGTYVPARGYPSLNRYGYYPRISFGFQMYNEVGLSREDMPNRMPQMDRDAQMSMADLNVEKKVLVKEEGDDANVPSSEPKAENPAGSAAPSIRSNFQETAFFYPQLKTDLNGNLIFSFTMPESMTTWKFQALAHSKQLQTGMTSQEVLTQKDLMVVPNSPRFLREGDEISLSSKLVSLSNQVQNGKIRLELLDAISLNDISSILIKSPQKMDFNLAAKGSQAFEWKVKIPSDYAAITYRFIAEGDKHSDGEENVLPVLSNRMLVTESMPFAITKEDQKSFDFTRMKQANESSTVKPHALTLEFTANPIWYAVQAMPYMMEYPQDCSEQIFTRFYANSLATSILKDRPKLREVINTWKSMDSDAFLSNLEKNQELKYVILEETPWVMEAQDESERKNRLSLLLDLNHMVDRQKQALDKLIMNQSASGGWPWFAGMEPSLYITQYIVGGLGHLKHLGILDEQDPRVNTMISEAIRFMDEEHLRRYNQLKRSAGDWKKTNHTWPFEIQYLYARSFFMEQQLQNVEALNYYKGQAAEFWVDRSVYMQGMSALALNRLEQTDKAKEIMRSVKEQAMMNAEIGMYWKDQHNGYYWYEAGTERHALMVEAFSEIMDDSDAVYGLKQWLIFNKQTNDWKTTRATAEACYALLLGVSDWTQDRDWTIEVGKEKFDSKDPSLKTEAGTGYLKRRWEKEEIKPEMTVVKVKKEGEAPAWGALYYQYFEQLDKISSSESPLKVRKQVFKVKQTSTGQVLIELNDEAKLAVGDRVRIRMEIETDRAMEFVHIKDMRSSGMEPVNVLSGMVYTGGLGFYRNTRDAATNFFIDDLRKGNYVLEYDLFVSHKGDLSNGITTIQCMYAPEFTAHSEGIRVKVE